MEGINLNFLSTLNTYNQNNNFFYIIFLNILLIVCNFKYEIMNYYFTDEVRVPPYDSLGNITYLSPTCRTYIPTNLKTNIKIANETRKEK